MEKAYLFFVTGLSVQAWKETANVAEKISFPIPNKKNVHV